jgi:hypothetical protein
MSITLDLSFVGHGGVIITHASRQKRKGCTIWVSEQSTFGADASVAKCEDDDAHIAAGGADTACITAGGAKMHTYIGEGADDAQCSSSSKSKLRQVFARKKNES